MPGSGGHRPYERSSPRKSIEVDLEYYESARYYGHTPSRPTRGPLSPTHIVNALMQIGQNGVSLLAMADCSFHFTGSLRQSYSFAVLPGIAVRFRYAARCIAGSQEKTSTERQAAYLNWMLTGGGHAKEIRLFDLGHLFVAAFVALRRKLAGKNSKSLPGAPSPS